MSSIKKKRLYYSAADDLHLLREVAGQNPISDPSRWPKVRENMKILCGKDFSDRSLKERVTLLTQKFSEKMKNDLYKSGVEDEVSELDDLLYTILQLIDELKSKPKKPKETSCQKGFNKREDALKNLTNEHENVALFQKEDNNNEVLIIDDNLIPYSQQSNAETSAENNFHPPFDLNNDAADLLENENRSPHVENRRGRGGRGSRSRPNSRGGGIMTPTRTRTGGIKQSSIKFLEKKNERWYEIRSRELAIEEKRLEIKENEKRKRQEMDEKRMEMEQTRLALEEKRLNAELDIFKNQQRLMEIAFNLK